MSNAMIAQNKMLHSIKRKNIQGLIKPYEVLTQKDGRQVTLNQWLTTARAQGKEEQVILTVEETAFNSSNILYYSQNEDIVEALCKNLHDNLKEYFPQSSLDIILNNSSEQSYMTKGRILSEKEITWANIIKRKYLPNPQDSIMSDDLLTTPPFKVRKSIYYGNTPQLENINANHYKNNEGKDNEKMIHCLESELRNKLQESQTSTKQYIDESIAILEKKLQQETKNMKSHLTEIDTKQSQQFDSLTRTMAAMATNISTIVMNMKPESTNTNANVANGIGKN